MKVVNYNINAANCNVLCAYNDAIRTLLAQYKQPKYRDLSTNITRGIEVEYFCDNIIYHHPTSVCIFL